MPSELVYQLIRNLGGGASKIVVGSALRAPRLIARDNRLVDMSSDMQLHRVSTDVLLLTCACRVPSPPILHVNVGQRCEKAIATWYLITLRAFRSMS